VCLEWLSPPMHLHPGLHTLYTAQLSQNEVALWDAMAMRCIYVGANFCDRLHPARSGRWLRVKADAQP